MTIEIEKELLERLIFCAQALEILQMRQGYLPRATTATIAAAESLIQSPDKNEEE